MSEFKVPVVKIQEVLPHKNAERLEIVNVDGYQVVVGKGQFKPGDLAYYVPPDSVLPQKDEYRFVWELDGGGKPRAIDYTVGVPEKYRRVTVKKLRKEWSEGILMPTIEPYRDSLNGIDFYKPADFALLRDNGNEGRQIQVQEGDDVAEFLGITHWQPPEPEVRTPYHNFEKGLKPKSLRGWFHWVLWKLGLGKNKNTSGYGNEKAPPSFPQVYDVENMKKFPGLFQDEEEVIITEKVHGSNMRVTYQKKLYCGSRNLWKAPKTECVWRTALKVNDWLGEWCTEHENYTVYMEVTPTQSGYSYGATAEKPRIFLFDILNPDGQFEEVFNNYGLWGEMREHWVPVLYRGKFKDADLRALVGGKSIIAPNQLREGIVIRPVKERHVHGLGRLQLKLVNPEFLLKDSQ